MPKKEEFWNPYRMIGPQGKPKYDTTTTHEKFQGICGRISGKIRALTPIFVGGREKGIFFRRGNKYCIPGTSFKGMLRSLLEIVGNGCVIVGKYPCKDTQNLCPACRLFGMSLPGEKNVLFQGKVYIADLVAIGSPKTSFQEILPGAPKPTHRAFYGAPTSRKCYHHQTSIWSNITNHSSQQSMIRKIQPLSVGTEFSLDIQCDNMTITELGLLLYCLELENGLNVVFSDGEKDFSLHGNMHHKIGGGKPLGYGSIAVEIAPKREDFYEPRQRYSTLDANVSSLSEKQWQKVRREQEKYHLNGSYDSDLLKQLRAMLLFPNESTPDPREYKYPDRDWFKENSQVGLKPIYEYMSKESSIDEQ